MFHETAEQLYNEVTDVLDSSSLEGPEYRKALIDLIEELKDRRDEYDNEN